MILGILFIILIGQNFYILAQKHKKSKWGYAILGVVTYYGSTFFYGIIYSIFYLMRNPNSFEEALDSWTLRLTTVAIGLLTTYILFYLLKRSWSKNQKEEEKSVNIDDIGTK